MRERGRPRVRETFVVEGELLRHIAILPFNASRTSEMTAEAALD